MQRAREYAARVWEYHSGYAALIQSALAAIIDGDAALASEKARADAWEADAARYASNAEYWKARADKAEAALRRIANMETPRANATVKNMAGVAVAALEANDAGR